MAQITLNSTGVASNGSLVLQSNGTTSAVVIDASQNVGVGVTPSGWGGSYKAVQITNNGLSLAATGAATGDLTLAFNAVYDSTDSRWEYVGTDKAGRYSQTGAGNHIWYVTNTNGTAGGAISFTQAMTLDASGNLGIGTSSPARKLHVTNVIRADGPMDSVYTGTTAGSTLGSFRMYGDGAGVTGETSIRGILNSGSITSSYLDFSTASSGTLAEKARIDSSGNFVVGTTSTALLGLITVNYNTNSTSNPTLAVRNGGGSGAFVSFTDAGSDTSIYGSITRSGGGVAYNTTSDQRLKENIVDAPEFGNIIDSIQVRSYDWKASGVHHRAGFIAQELATVAPEAVYQPNDTKEMMSVDYSKLVPMLVKEVQSLRARVAQLESN